MKKIALIGTNGLPAKYGGFETFINYLTIKLKNKFEFLVYCSKENNAKRLKKFNEAHLIYIPLKANGAQSILYDIISIIHSLFYADILVILGTPGALILPFIKLLKKKIIVNFGGMEWKREKWPKLIRMYLKFTEGIAVKYADVVIADNQAFVNYIKNEYNKDAELIEYGGDHVITAAPGQEFIGDYPFLDDNYIVSVSRAQIDNNMQMLLEAFIKCKTDLKLVLISNWNTSEFGIKLKQKYMSVKNIILLDAIYDQKLLDLIRGRALLYIHTHSFCGTAPSLVEAMHLNLPVVCYDIETNRYTTENKSIYFKEVSELAYILSNLDTMLLEKNKKEMTQIAKARYSWNKISNKYAIVFEA